MVVVVDICAKGMSDVLNSGPNGVMVLKTGPDRTGRSDRSNRRPVNYPVRSAQ